MVAGVAARPHEHSEEVNDGRVLFQECLVLREDKAGTGLKGEETNEPNGAVLEGRSKGNGGFQGAGAVHELVAPTVELLFFAFALKGFNEKFGM